MVAETDDFVAIASEFRSLATQADLYVLGVGTATGFARNRYALASGASRVVATTANSGWISEENSLANMDDDELEARGAETGLSIVYKRGSNPPQKIQPNQVPSGVDKLIDRATQARRRGAT